MSGIRRCVYCHKLRNEDSKKNNVSFHCFPLEKKDLLQKWLHALAIPDFVPTKSHLVCSEHFESRCFEQSLCADLGLNLPVKRRLIENAVPLSQSVSFDFLGCENEIMPINQTEQVCLFHIIIKVIFSHLLNNRNIFSLRVIF